MKICCFGSLNLDYVYHVKHFVRSGETIASTNRSIVCGGKGLNQSIAIARSGSKVFHAGNVSATDGTILLNALQSNDVNVDYVRQQNAVNGHAIIQVDEEGENCIVLYGGTNQMTTNEQIEKVISNFDEGDYIVLQNEINLLPEIIRAASAKKMKVILNPSPVDGIKENVPLDLVDYLFVNASEAMEISGENSSEESCRTLRRKYPRMTIVCTLGADGAMVFDGTFTYCEGRKTHVVDTTGAGDTFLGYYVGLMAEGKSTLSCMKGAIAAATLCVGRLGASVSIPHRAQVEALLAGETIQ